MQYTTNLNLNKPEGADQYDVADWNWNSDKIDSEITALKNITNATFKTALLNFCYPIGSLYWSSKSTSPAILFGGTWTQIKDKFVWAKGDSDTVNATGGAKTVTLTVANLPSHNHTFTGSSVTTNANNRGHTHSVTASGSISGGTYKFTGTAVNTGAMSGNATGSVAMTGMGSSDAGTGTKIRQSGNMTITVGTNTTASNVNGAGKNNQVYGNFINIDVSHTHSVTASGTISVTTNPTFTGSAVTSGAESQNHTHTVTASGTIGNTGSGTTVDKMPPYIVKYCWERTA